VTAPDPPVCPRCGSASGDGRFCPECGLNLAEAGVLPTRDQWLRERAQAPWRSRAKAAPTADPGHGKPRWRGLLEVGIPLAVVVAIVIVVLLPGSGPVPAGSLHYDTRAAPLVSSLRLSRAHALRTGSCHGCASVVPDAGGCSGYRSDWTCDVRVDVHTRSPQFLRVSSELETYKVTWNSNGCWQAIENCVSAADSSGHICPPPVPVYLRGCIPAPAG
jgi:hypothetical protein